MSPSWQTLQFAAIYNPVLSSLTLQDFVLLAHADLSLAKGLTVITGETGAGKSIILDAIGWVLGERASAAQIRPGANEARVTAVFDLPAKHPALQLLAENDLGEDELIIRRSVNADGKSKALVNDQPVSLALLKQLGELLVDIHAQFDNQALFQPSEQRHLLDAYGNHATSAVAESWTQWQAQSSALQALQAEMAKAESESAYLQHAAGELDQAAVQEDEEEQLQIQRSRLQQLTKIIDTAQLCEDRLSSAAGNVHEAARALARVPESWRAAAAPVIETIDTLLDQLSNAQAQLDALQPDRDEMNLGAIEERLFALRALARKHQTTVAELPALHKSITQRLLLLEDQSDTLQRLSQQVAQTRQTYEQAAGTLTAARQKSAQALGKVILKELKPLKLEKAQLEITVTPLPESQWGAHGQDQVQIMVAMNPGAALAPLAKVASGGELARLMLALKTILAQKQPPVLWVFDEVDSGVGGAVAAAVGDCLARLAKSKQVLTITHSPQIAGRADDHWQVSKHSKAGKTLAQITPLKEGARQEELARMLSGHDITDTARAAAADLLRVGT